VAARRGLDLSRAREHGDVLGEELSTRKEYDAAFLLEVIGRRSEIIDRFDGTRGSSR